MDLLKAFRGRKDDPLTLEHAKERAFLLQSMTLAIKEVQLYYATNFCAGQAIKDCRATLQLCASIEGALKHGLRANLFGQSSSFWPVALKVSRKQAIEYINSLQFVQSDSGRCRAWIRLAVNECSLESYVSVLHSETTLLAKYYESYSFLRDEESIGALRQLLTGLSQLSFNIIVDSASLEFEVPPAIQPVVTCHVAIQPHEGLSLPSSQTSDSGQLTGKTSPIGNLGKFSIDKTPSQVQQWLSVPEGLEKTVFISEPTKGKELSSCSLSGDESSISSKEPKAIFNIGMSGNSPVELGQRANPSRTETPKTSESPCSQLMIMEDIDASEGSASEQKQGINYLSLNGEGTGSEVFSFSPLKAQTTLIQNMQASKEVPAESRPKSFGTADDVTIGVDATQEDNLMPGEGKHDEMVKMATEQDEREMVVKTEHYVLEGHLPTDHLSIGQDKDDETSDQKGMNTESTDETKTDAGQIDKERVNQDKTTHIQQSDQEGLGKEMLGKETTDHEIVRQDEINKVSQNMEQMNAVMMTQLDEPKVLVVKRHKPSDVPDESLILDSSTFQCSPQTAGLGTLLVLKHEPDITCLLQDQSLGTVIITSNSPTAEPLPVPEKLSEPVNKDHKIIKKEPLAGETQCLSGQPMSLSPVPASSVGDLFEVPLMDPLSYNGDGDDLVGNVDADHFSHEPDIVDLEEKIRALKAKMNSNSSHEDKDRLISYQIRLQKLKESNDTIKYMMGHMLCQQTHQVMMKGYTCDGCGNRVHGLVRTWYRCSSCLLCIHEDCLKDLSRPCINTIKEETEYMLELCPEKGLTFQRFCCAQCSKRLDPAATDTKLCDYSGLWYCGACHHGDTTVIPARVMHNWDFKQYKVCCRCSSLLGRMYQKPLLSVKDINPKLYNYVNDLSTVETLRETLGHMKNYIIQCRIAKEENLSDQLETWLPSKVAKDVYSLHHLVELQRGMLVKQLQNMRSSFSQHIKTCTLCAGRGYYCIYCNTDELLFPFDNDVVICPGCTTVSHRYCVSKSNECTKCVRLKQLAKRTK